jgi:hypothetical protein
MDESGPTGVNGIQPQKKATMPTFRREKVPRRNERCPCGSGKKAKRCCLAKIKMLATLPPRVRKQLVVAKVLRRPVGETPPVPKNLLNLTDGKIITSDGVEIPIQSAEITI